MTKEPQASNTTISSPEKNISTCILLGIIVTFIWGFNFVVAEDAVSQLPPFLLVALRYFVVGLVFLPFTKRNDLSWRYIFLVGFFYGVVQFSGLFWGLSLGVSSGVAATLIQSQALFTILLATIFINEKYSLLQWISLLAGTFGLVLIAASGDVTAPLDGVLCVILGGAGWAASNIVLKKAGKISPWTMTVWQSITVFPIMLILSFVFESGQYKALTEMSAHGIGAVLYISLLATGLGNYIWYYLVQRFGPSNTAPFSLLIPVVAILSGWVVFGEKLTMIQVIGVVLTLCALTLLQFISYRKTLSVQNAKVDVSIEQNDVPIEQE